jgi:hypothetical protein
MEAPSYEGKRVYMTVLNVDRNTAINAILL